MSGGQSGRDSLFPVYEDKTSLLDVSVYRFPYLNFTHLLTLIVSLEDVGG